MVITLTASVNTPIVFSEPRHENEIHILSFQVLSTDEDALSKAVANVMLLAVSTMYQLSPRPFPSYPLEAKVAVSVEVQIDTSDTFKPMSMMRHVIVPIGMPAIDLWTRFFGRLPKPRVLFEYENITYGSFVADL